MRETYTSERACLGVLYRSGGRVFRHFLFDPCNSFEISESKREQGHRDDTCYQPIANRRNRWSVNNTGTFSQLRMDSEQRWCVIFCANWPVGFIAIRAPSASGTICITLCFSYRSKHNKLSFYQFPVSRSFSIDRSNEPPTCLGSNSFTPGLNYLLVCILYIQHVVDRHIVFLQFFSPTRSFLPTTYHTVTRKY